MPISLWPTRRRRVSKQNLRPVRHPPAVVASPQSHFHGAFTVRFHQELEDWRATRLDAIDQCWSPLALAMIEIEIHALLRAVRENADKLELFGVMTKG